MPAATSPLRSPSSLQPRRLPTSDASYFCSSVCNMGWGSLNSTIRLSVPNVVQINTKTIIIRPTAPIDRPRAAPSNNEYPGSRRAAYEQQTSKGII